MCFRYSAFSAPCVVYWITKKFVSQEAKASSVDTCRCNVFRTVRNKEQRGKERQTDGTLQAIDKKRNELNCTSFRFLVVRRIFQCYNLLTVYVRVRQGPMCYASPYDPLSVAGFIQ